MKKTELLQRENCIASITLGEEKKKLLKNPKKVRMKGTGLLIQLRPTLSVKKIF